MNSLFIITRSRYKAYQDLKSNLLPFGYEEEDLLNLERYNVLALIKTSKNYSSFVVDLPEPIEKLKIPIVS